MYLSFAMFKLDIELAKNMGEATYFDGELLGFYFTIKNLHDFINESISKNYYAFICTNLFDYNFSDPISAESNIIYIVKDKNNNFDIAYLDQNNNEWSCEYGNITSDVIGYCDINICTRTF